DGTVIAKSGAQGLFVFGMRQQGIAVALKLADGGEASQPGIICSVLEKLHVGADLSERINQHFSADLYNDAGQLIGHRESSLRLKFH
ncbi:asparaginase, partial [Paenibacillus sepulcri]|nr:asparaginase [Paenibacillus sepulcri]